MIPGLRRRPIPPQPVEPESETWRTRFYQWLIDRIEHLDECLDRAQSEMVEMRAEVNVWMAAGKQADGTLDEQLQAHLGQHALIDATGLAKTSVWRLQGSILRDVLKFATEGTVIAGIIAALKLTGVL